MKTDFAVIIISHERPECATWHTLRDAGYTGPIIIIIDDGDTSRDEYLKRYGDAVRVFHKSVGFDIGDNFDGPNGIATFARNEAQQIAVKEGIRTYLLIDDDLKSINFRVEKDGHLLTRKAHDLDKIMAAFAEFAEIENVLSIGFGNGTHYIGGVKSFDKNRNSRWVYTAFVIKTDRHPVFRGRYSEDTIFLLDAGRKGWLTCAIVDIQGNCDVWNPKNKKQKSGGCQETYREMRGYILRWYELMYFPAEVRLRAVQTQTGAVDFVTEKKANNCFAKLLPSKVRKND